MGMVVDNANVEVVVRRQVEEVAITDVHTHLFPPSFGNLLLWGIDDLLTYHYLIAEYFRYSTMGYEKFFQLDKKQQADLIWDTLFIQRSPVSEAQRGVLTVLRKLGLDTGSRNLEEYRQYFASFTVNEYVDKVFATAGIKEAVMTNDPFDPKERVCWEERYSVEPRFKAALRLDALINGYAESWEKLKGWGYDVSRDLDRQSVREVRRFLTDWATKMNPLYMAVSLPPEFNLPEDTLRGRVIEGCVLPVCEELGIPLAMMIGVKKLVNRKLGLAGDAVGKGDIGTVEYLCRAYPDNKFLVTMLSRENQHELAVLARKFRNLMVFGCWWFLNNPSLVEEITRMRMELLGLSFTPQHSDARVLDQLIYKWEHSRKVIADVLVDKYLDLLATGWQLTEEDIKRDVRDLFGGSFWRFMER